MKNILCGIRNWMNEWNHQLDKARDRILHKIAMKFTYNAAQKNK